MAATQTYATHRRVVPLFHLGVLLCLLTNFVWSIHRLLAVPSGDTIVGLVLAVGLLLLWFFVRAFPLKTQDRLIRLEMRLRLREILPPDLQGRVHEFTPRQLIAMRFASDAELPALAATVLKDNIQDGTTIKEMVKDWQPDDLRV